MALVWTNPRKPHALADLSAVDRVQLEAVGRLYFGDVRPIESLLPPFEGNEDDGVLFNLEVAAIEEDGVHAYDSWTYMVDGGTFFRAGTTEVVGEIIQFGFEAHHETEAGERFAEAYRRHNEG